MNTEVYGVDFISPHRTLGSRVQTGATIRDEDRKRVNSSIGAVPMISDNNSIFRTNYARQSERPTRAHAARILADVVRGKWCPKFPRCLMLLAYNSIRLSLLEFCFSIFVVSCSSLSKLSKTVSNSVMFRSFSLSKLFFHKSFTLLYSIKFQRC